NEGSYKDIVMVLLTIILVVIIETILYTIMEILMNDTTIGKKLFNLKVEKINNEKYTIFSKVIRNFMKSTSKYLLCVPFLFQLCSKNNQTLYDMIIKTTVTDKKVY
ncbi:MAG: RDD family protein, partial [Clostridium sp.]